jgi:hypothetical protein
MGHIAGNRRHYVFGGSGRSTATYTETSRFVISDEWIICPLQKGLPLPRATPDIAGFAIGANLGFVAPECAPSFDLGTINVRQAPAQIVSAIPLKPAAGIRFDNPTFVPPYAQGLTALDAKGVEGWIRLVADLGLSKPLWRQFVTAIVTILTFEDPHLEHRIGAHVRFEATVKILSRFCRDHVFIRVLQFVVHGHDVADVIHGSLDAFPEQANSSAKALSPRPLVKQALQIWPKFEEQAVALLQHPGKQRQATQLAQPLQARQTQP